MYWRDSGLLHALLGVSDAGALLHQPWVGASWEGFVIEALINEAARTAPKGQPCFLRTSDGMEIDLLMDFGQERWAFEVKLTTAPSTADWERLNRAADLVGAKRRFLVSRAATSAGDGERGTGGLEWALGRLRS